MNSYQKVVDIATKELRSCYAQEGIIAGLHHFTDYWARDGYFAALGAMAIGDYNIVEKMVQNFFKYQRADGLIPYRIMQGPVTFKKYFGRPTFYESPKPTFKLHDFGPEVLDGTTLTLLVTALLGFTNSKIPKFYTSYVKKALEYLAGREKNGLLWDGVMSEWHDTALKWGNLLYSNIIYWYMFNRLSAWIKNIDPKWSKDLKLKEGLIAKSLRKQLWNATYFSDWYDYKRQDYFYPFGNCLAIAWGLTTKSESDSILKKCKEALVGFTLETNMPKYPWWRIDLFRHLAHIGDYQNRGLLWWQPGLAYIAALKGTNKIAESKKILNKMISKVIADNSILECYERSGKKVKRLLYTSEEPFAWSSGMLLWALLSK